MSDSGIADPSLLPTAGIAASLRERQASDPTGSASRTGKISSYAEAVNRARVEPTRRNLNGKWFGFDGGGGVGIGPPKDST